MQATTMTSACVPVAKGKARRTLTLPKELLAELDAWRAEQRPIPTESQAISELLRKTLEAWRKEQERNR